MARQQAVAEVNAFVKGLVTEASPLTFPDNASIDEVNLVPQRDGSRKRRLGMDFEDGYTELDSGQSPVSDVTYFSFNWKGPGGYTEVQFSVVQFGNKISFFRSSTLPMSNNLVSEFTISGGIGTSVSMDSVDGVLVVADGSGTIFTFDYDGTDIIQGSGRLKIRDLFGVEDVVGNDDLLEGSGVTIRPSIRTEAHIFNLRNQTYAIPRYQGNAEVTQDPISFFATTAGVYPSNSDNLNVYLYADANDSGDRSTKRYFAVDNINNPLGTNRAPLGYFIIDALNRGASRIDEITRLHGTYSVLSYRVSNLPTDRTPGGANVIATYAGRVFFAGFSSQVVNGDNQSPRMNSYVLFSKLVQSQSDVFKCYQDGDPTSSEAPDLVDTDGGFLRLDGAYNIQRLINVGDALMAIAENGVWKITGGSGYGFKATDYVVSKVTEHGTVSPSSAVLVDNTLMYWSDDGIYHVNQNQYGDWIAENLTTTTIQSYFDDIPSTSKSRCFGAYDSYTRKVRWLYNNFYGATLGPMELVLDVGLGAFYPSKLSRVDSTYPLPVSMVRIPPYQISSGTSQVITGDTDDVVDSSANNVIIAGDVVDASLSELYYITITRTTDSTMRYSFSLYRDGEFLDWKSQNGVGIDAAAYLLTGWTGMGDFQRQKQVAYLTIYSIKTETGFDLDYEPINPSSILVQSQWNWTNLEASGKWSPEFQAYRHKRAWIPANSSSGFDDGDYVVTTKNKLRGRGRVLSLKFSTEPGKDFHLLGWSYLGSISGTV